jgi:hypothetical protein
MMLIKHVMLQLHCILTIHLHAPLVPLLCIYVRDKLKEYTPHRYIVGGLRPPKVLKNMI